MNCMDIYLRIIIWHLKIIINSNFGLDCINMDMIKNMMDLGLRFWMLSSVLNFLIVFRLKWVISNIIIGLIRWYRMEWFGRVYRMTSINTYNNSWMICVYCILKNIWMMVMICLNSYNLIKYLRLIKKI